MIGRLLKPDGGIRTVEGLRTHLQTAIELEHSVIPPYLCALYSIEDGANTAAAASLHDVVLEEMLHLTLAANVLNAIGGAPDLIHPDFVPRYPSYLPHGNDSIVLNLAPFSRETLAEFLKIEHPSAPHSPPEANQYASIGQFYAAIVDGLEMLAKTVPNLFRGKRSRQIAPEYYYNSGGEVVEVTDLQSARRALEIIVLQGEGHRAIYDRERPPRKEDTEDSGALLSLHANLCRPLLPQGRYRQIGSHWRPVPGGLECGHLPHAHKSQVGRLSAEQRFVARLTSLQRDL